MLPIVFPIALVSDFRYMIVLMEQSPTGIEALSRAVKRFPTQVEFAKAIGVPQSRVSEVLRGQGRGIPAEWCPKIESATDGDVRRWQLRPDLWPEQEEAAQ